MANTTVLSVQIITPSPSSTALGKRKARDDEVPMDLSKPLLYPAPEAVVEAMRQRILQLENELHAAKKQKSSSVASQNTIPVFVGSSKTLVPGPSAAATSKAEAKTIKMRGKNLFDQVKKAAKVEKYQLVTRTVKVEDHFTQADFDLVFGNSGTLVQPTPTNKPKSNVWIKTYSGHADYHAIFGEAYNLEQLKGYQWSQGSIFAGKSQKLGQVQLEIEGIEVQWSKNTEKTVLKVNISEAGGSRCGYLY